jgi:ABC-2 type transport system permease protein
MSKFWAVFKREYAQVVKKKSFLVGLILTPALMAGFMVLPAVLATMKSSTTEHLAVIDRSAYNIGETFSESLERYKLDDDSTAYYSVERIFDLEPGETERFQTVSDSLADLVTDKQLKYFVVIDPQAPYSDTGTYLVTNSDNIRSIKRFERRLSNALSSVRLEESDINLSVDSVLVLTDDINLATRNTKGESLPFEVKYFGALIFVGIMFGMIIGYGQLVMRSVIDEKNSRIMEVLVSSVTPFQLMFGKIMGLGAATLTQVAIWFLIGLGLFTMRATLEIDPAIGQLAFDPALVIFFVLYLVSGYMLFSALFALIGSIVTSEKEAQNFVAPISMVMILPFILGISIVQNPHSTLAVTFSMIPFTAPTMAMMRLVFVAPSVTDYSLFSGIIGESLLSFLVIVATVVLVTWITARIFRVGILMYGKRPTLPEIVKWIKYS